MKRVVFLMLLSLCGIIESHASENERAGFILGTGIGVGCTGVISEDISGPERMIDLGPALSFKVGYAPVDLFQIYLGFSFSMFQSEKFVNMFNPELFFLWPILLPINVTQASHMMFQLLGVTFYLNPETPGLILGGGIGASSIGEPFWNKTEGAVSGWVEAGIEFARHFSVKLTLFPVRIEYDWYDQETGSNHLFRSFALSAVLTAEYCFY